jgi:Na+-transporting methylmalonyl-CoA/oxaloacetate decarboxylase gamma subunit
VDHPLATALTITLIGMTLLFLALIFFYGLTSFMMSALQRRSASQDTAEGPAGPAGDDEAMLQAAAIAVALARAEVEEEESARRPATGPAAATGTAPSPWWTLHHQRQMASPTNLRRAR